MNEPSKPAEFPKPTVDSWWKFITFVAIAIVVTFAYPAFIAWLNGFRTPDERSQFGDQFGALNALTSALAFGALIYTVILQRRDLANQLTELQLQRKELELQRRELELQRQEMRDSRVELSKQAEAQAAYVQATLLAARINGVGQAMACGFKFRKHETTSEVLSKTLFSLLDLAEENHGTSTNSGSTSEKSGVSDLQPTRCADSGKPH
jgi:hypothetical protein